MTNIEQAATAFWTFLAIFGAGAIWYVLTLVYDVKCEEINIRRTFLTGLLGWIISSIGMIGAVISGIIWVVQTLKH